MSEQRKYLKLHNADDNTVVIVSSDEIELAHIVSDNNGKYTEIWLASTEDDLCVYESPDKLYSKLSDFGFVRCHRACDNATIIFNIDYFIMAIVDDDNTSIRLRGVNNATNEASVNETPEKIYNVVYEADCRRKRNRFSIADYNTNIILAKAKDGLSHIDATDDKVSNNNVFDYPE